MNSSFRKLLEIDWFLYQSDNETTKKADCLFNNLSREFTIKEIADWMKENCSDAIYPFSLYQAKGGRNGRL